MYDKHVYWYSCEVTLYLSDCNKLEYSRQIFEKYYISNLMKWEPSCSMRTEGRTRGGTDMTKPAIGFRNFVNAPNKTVPLQV